MLNPSKADASVDDPTIGRCIKFSKREGCGALSVANVYAWRATNPKDLALSTDPIGPDWRVHFEAFLAEADGPLIAGWGAHKGIGVQVAIIKRLVSNAGRSLLRLGLSKEGHPRHPLYICAGAPLVPA